MAPVSALGAAPIDFPIAGSTRSDSFLRFCAASDNGSDSVSNADSCRDQSIDPIALYRLQPDDASVHLQPSNLVAHLQQMISAQGSLRAIVCVNSF